MRFVACIAQLWITFCVSYDRDIPATTAIDHKSIRTTKGDGDEAELGVGAEEEEEEEGGELTETLEGVGVKADTFPRKGGVVVVVVVMDGVALGISSMADTGEELGAAVFAGTPLYTTH